MQTQHHRSILNPKQLLPMVLWLGIAGFLGACSSKAPESLYKPWAPAPKSALIHADDFSDGYDNAQSLMRYDFASLRWLVFDSGKVVPTRLEGIAGADIYEVYFRESFFDEDSLEPMAWDGAQAQSMVLRANRLGSPIWVIGYADKSGSAPHNKRLALERARSVAKLLQAAGASAGQIRIAGAGVSDKYEMADKNRRAEILIRPIFSGAQEWIQ